MADPLDEKAQAKKMAKRGDNFEMHEADEGQALSVPPSIDFKTLVFSFSTSSLIHLGEMADPASGETTVNLPLAQQNIDILSILQEKTQGNLSAEESRLIDSLLYDLRIKYIEKSKSAK